MNVNPYSSAGSNSSIETIMQCSIRRRRTERPVGEPGLMLQCAGGGFGGARSVTEGLSYHSLLAEGAVDLILDVGKPTFNDAFGRYLRRFANINSYMVVAYRKGASGEPHLLMASSQDFPILYKSIFYKRDPNRQIILDNSMNGVVILFPNFADDHYSAAYRCSVFQSSGIIDKMSTAYWAGDVCYYVNFYRMHGEPPFSDEDRLQILEVSDLISNLIARHFERGPDAGGKAAGFSESSLEKIVKALSPASPLTDREVQVCTLILIGCSSEAIALRLGIAVSSVLTYRRRAYERLAIVSQNELFAKVFAQLSAPYEG